MSAATLLLHVCLAAGADSEPQPAGPSVPVPRNGATAEWFHIAEAGSAEELAKEHAALINKMPHFSLNMVDEHMLAALDVACLSNNVATVKWLLQAGAKVNRSGPRKMTALH